MHTLEIHESLKRFNNPKEGLLLEAPNKLEVCSHSILSVEVSATQRTGENAHDSTATVRFTNHTGAYEAHITPLHGGLNHIEFKGLLDSEVRSMIISFEFAAAFLRAKLNLPAERDYPADEVADDYDDDY